MHVQSSQTAVRFGRISENQLPELISGKQTRVSAGLGTGARQTSLQELGKRLSNPTELRFGAEQNDVERQLRFAIEKMAEFGNPFATHPVPVAPQPAVPMFAALKETVEKHNPFKSAF